MPAPRLSNLRARKQLILAEADLHRQLLTLERLRWEQRGAKVQQLVAGKRWFLLGGALVIGVVLARRWNGLARWLPTAIATTRAVLG